MSTLSHERPTTWWSLVEVWTAIAITAMWAAVAITAIADPVIESNDGSRVPAAIPIALFAMIGSWAVAHYGLRKHD